MSLYTRLDTLESIDITSQSIAPRILYGIAYPSAIVRTSALSPLPSASHSIPYLRLNPSSKWAVRLIDQPSLDNRAAQLAFLSRRDGWTCFYCDQPLNEHTATVEHIVCTAHQGPTHADNLCLSCSSCNAAVGSLPAVQKVKLAISIRVGRIAVSAFKVQQHRVSSRIGNANASGKRGAK